MSLTRYGTSSGSGLGLGSGSITVPQLTVITGTKAEGTRVYTWDPDSEPGKLAMDYVDRELKLGLIQEREKKIINAAIDPKDWVKNREPYMNKIKERVAGQLATQYTKYTEAGFPVDEALARASTSANTLLVQELTDLELIYPGSATILNSAAHVAADRNDIFNLAHGAAEKQVDKKAIYKEMRALKKAKRAKKLSKA